MEQRKEHGVLVLVIHVHLGPGPVGDGVRRSSRCFSSCHRWWGWCRKQQEQCWDKYKGSRARCGCGRGCSAAIVNLVVHLLRKVFSSNIICAGLVLNFRFFFLLSYSRLVGNICIGHDITIGFNWGFFSLIRLGGEDLWLGWTCQCRFSLVVLVAGLDWGLAWDAMRLCQKKYIILHLYYYLMDLFILVFNWFQQNIDWF